MPLPDSYDDDLSREYDHEYYWDDDEEECAGCITDGEEPHTCVAAGEYE